MKEIWFEAILNEDLSLLGTYISNGMNPNTTHPTEKVTSLVYCIRYKKFKSIFYLIENGADLNIQSNYGLTPLMIAIEYGYEDVVNKLIDSGALLNITDNYDCTALMHALKYKEFELASKLLEAGADPNHEDLGEETAVDYALVHNEDKAYELFEPYYDKLKGSARKKMNVIRFKKFSEETFKA
jgi:ankyrin repeat protein